LLYGLIFANGDLNMGPAVQAALDVPAERIVIAVDGGLRIALQCGLRPALVIGDMDSADPAMLAEAAQHGAEIARFPANKDETDLELALMAAAQRRCDPIRVIGAVGDRIDQTLGNIYLLALPLLHGRDVQIVSHAQTTWLTYPGAHVVHGQAGDTLSLVPLAGSVIGITTSGLAYPLRHETLAFGPARGISNVFTDGQARVTFESGLLLMTHTMGRA